MPDSLPLSIRATFAIPPRGGAEAMRDRANLESASGPLAKALTLGMQKLAFRAQKERFTGEGPFPVAQKRLGVKSGRLRRDVHAETVTATATGFSGRIGAAVEYFGAHEVGFDGNVPVRAHTREPSHKPIAGPWAVRSDGKLTAAASRASIRTGHSLRLPASVRAHTRHMKIPARAPLRTAIEEHAEKILGAEISGAVTQHLA